MTRRRDTSNRSPLRIVVFAVLIVVETATVIVAIRIATGSWAGGTAAGAISGALTAATYPALVRRRQRPLRDPSETTDSNGPKFLRPRPPR